MIDIQCDIAIIGEREVSRPYQVGFSPKASGFYPFGDATALTGEGDVGAVACLISSCGLNQSHHITNVALLRGQWHRQKDKNRSPSAKNQTEA